MVGNIEGWINCDMSDCVVRNTDEYIGRCIDELIDW
jgi:hypothetical protein